MSKFIDYLNKLGERHRKRLEREIKMDEFLNGSKDNCLRINEISRDVKTLAETVDGINTKVNGLEEDMGRLHSRLDTIGLGTQKELFDTLYHWKKILVDRGWKTPLEMKEIEGIYRIYHDGLGGNGQGEKYYEEIKNLPEKEIAP